MFWCIYQITNKLNGKRYIGQHRYTDESNIMGCYFGSGVIISKAVRKYGKENFEREVLYKRIRSVETANAMEIWAIEKYKPEYNIAKGGLGFNFKHTEETKKKISESLKGRKGYFLGKHFSEEHKRKISESNKGRASPMKNKKHSDSSKALMSASQKGHKVSNETRKKISDANKGRVYSEIAIKHFSEGQKGRKMSEETKKKISETLKNKAKEHTNE